MSRDLQLNCVISFYFCLYLIMLYACAARFDVTENFWGKLNNARMLLDRATDDQMNETAWCPHQHAHNRKTVGIDSARSISSTRAWPPTPDPSPQPPIEGLARPGVVGSRHCQPLAGSEGEGRSPARLLQQQLAFACVRACGLLLAIFFFA